MERGRVSHPGLARTSGAGIEPQLRFLASAAIGALCGLSVLIVPVIAPEPGDELPWAAWPLYAIPMGCGAIVGVLFGALLLAIDRRPKPLRRMAWAALPTMLYGAYLGQAAPLAVFDLAQLALWMAIYLLAYAAQWLAIGPALAPRS
jgi:hypothetical protein